MTDRQPPKGAQAALRTIRLLKLFTGEAAELTLGDISLAAGLNKTTAHRLLQALCSEELLERNPSSGSYRLGRGMMALGVQALSNNDLRRRARPHLKRLADETGETATLEVAVGDSMLILDEVCGRHFVAANGNVGTRWPMHATSTGKAFLAFDEAGPARLGKRLTPMTGRTITDRDALATQLGEVRARGLRRNGRRTRGWLLGRGRRRPRWHRRGARGTVHLRPVAALDRGSARATRRDPDDDGRHTASREPERHATIRRVTDALGDGIDTHASRRPRRDTIKMLFRLAVIACLALAAVRPAAALELEAPDVVLTGVPAELSVTDAEPGTVVTLEIAGQQLTKTAGADGGATFTNVIPADAGTITATASSGGDRASRSLRVLPGWVSVMPALLAIAIALAMRNVVPALLLGLWLGATALQSFSPAGAGRGLLDSFQVYVRGALADPDRASIILFTMMIGGMVGIITRNGGMASIVRSLVSRARTAVGGQVAVWLMGLMIFFDDYSNTLVVGNTARSLTDQLRVSREKLAYIVDSTAAPVACIALITTWIGYQIGLIDQALGTIDALQDVEAYGVFLASIPYSFYPILAIFFVLLVVVDRARLRADVHGGGTRPRRCRSNRSLPMRCRRSRATN